MLKKFKKLIQEFVTEAAEQHYLMDNEPASMKQMRSLVDVVLGHGPAAYHYSVQDVIRILEKDGRIIKVIV